MPYCQWCAASRGAYDDLKKGPEADIPIVVEVCEESVPSLAEIIAAHQAAVESIKRSAAVPEDMLGLGMTNHATTGKLRDE